MKSKRQLTLRGSLARFHRITRWLLRTLPFVTFVAAVVGIAASFAYHGSIGTRINGSFKSVAAGVSVVSVAYVRFGAEYESSALGNLQLPDGGQTRTRKWVISPPFFFPSIWLDAHPT